MKFDKKTIIAIAIVVIIAVIAVCYVAGVFNTLGIPGTSFGEGEYVAGKDIPVGVYSVDGMVYSPEGGVTYYGYEQKIVVQEGAVVSVPEGVTIKYIGKEK